MGFIIGECDVKIASHALVNCTSSILDLVDFLGNQGKRPWWFPPKKVYKQIITGITSCEDPKKSCRNLIYRTSQLTQTLQSLHGFVHPVPRKTKKTFNRLKQLLTAKHLLQLRTAMMVARDDLHQGLAGQVMDLDVGQRPARHRSHQVGILGKTTHFYPLLGCETLAGTKESEKPCWMEPLFHRVFRCCKWLSFEDLLDFLGFA